MITKLEEIILDATEAAQDRYFEISNGGWLSYGHESFLHCKISEAIFDGHSKYVDVDISIKKMVEYIDSKYKEREMDRKRFDVCVWQKEAKKCDAIIEIKRFSNDISGVLADAEKIELFFKKYKKHAPSKAYLLIYCEANAKDKETCANKIDAKLMRLNDALAGWNKLGGRNGEPEEFDYGWSVWHASLFRIDNPA